MNQQRLFKIETKCEWEGCQRPATRILTSKPAEHVGDYPDWDVEGVYCHIHADEAKKILEGKTTVEVNAEMNLPEN